MKTLQEFYEEVKKSDDLKKALAEAVKAGKVTDFLKANGCDATADEMKEFVVGRIVEDKPMRELSDDELEMVAGGSEDGDSDVCSTLCSEWACWF